MEERRVEATILSHSKNSISIETKSGGKKPILQRLAGMAWRGAPIGRLPDDAKLGLAEALCSSFFLPCHLFFQPSPERSVKRVSQQLIVLMGRISQLALNDDTCVSCRLKVWRNTVLQLFELTRTTL